MHYANNDYPKERLVSDFLSCNSPLSSWTWCEDLSAQYAGVDLSAVSANTNIYLDLKLKNAGYTNVPTEPSKRWSVEIYRLKRGNLVPGWFVSSDHITNLYGFEEVYGSTFEKIDSCDVWYWKKETLKQLIEQDTLRSVADIASVARWMLESDRKYYRLSDTFCLSRTGRDADNLTINLCFNREVLEKISIKKTYFQIKYT